MENLSGQVSSAGRVSQTHLKHNVETNVTRLGPETRTGGGTRAERKRLKTKKVAKIRRRLNHFRILLCLFVENYF